MTLLEAGGIATHRPETADRPWALIVRLLAATVALSAVVIGLCLWIEPPSALGDLDEDVTRAINALVVDHHWLIDPLKATSYVFHAWVFRGTVVLVVAWLAFRRAWSAAVWTAVTTTAAGLLGLALKILVDRPRPDLPTDIAHFPGGSFPSGHAMTAMAGVVTLVLLVLPRVPEGRRWIAWTVALVIGVAAGLCRVALGVHYLSDVLAGWFFGGLVVALTTFVYHRSRTPRDA